MGDRGKVSHRKLSQGLCVSNYTVLSQQSSCKIVCSSHLKCWFQIPLKKKMYFI